MKNSICKFCFVLLFLACSILPGCEKADVEPGSLPVESKTIAPQLKGYPTIQASEKLPVVFNTIATGAEGTTYTGTVTATGGIVGNGTYVMPTKQMGMALHCDLELTFPDGTISIRMNCNMVTLDGVWKVLSGTGAYENLHGGGPLVMPDDVQEILTGDISWK